VTGMWHLPATPSSNKVKERVELYLYSHSGPSWPVLGWTLPLPLALFMILMATSVSHYIALNSRMISEQ